MAITERPGSVTPLLVEAERLAAQKVAARGRFSIRYDVLTLDDFEAGAGADAAVALRCARGIAARTSAKVVFGFACGDLAELLGFVERIPRINDVLAVLRALQVLTL